MFGIELLQKLSSPFCDIFFKTITILAEPIVGLIIVATVYWCVDKKFSMPFCLTVVSTFGINNLLKNILRVGRPYNKYGYMYAPEGTKQAGKLFIQRSSTATGYSFPSGHTQFATSTYGSIAFHLKKWARFLLIALIVLVALSRMYLGVHTFYDVTVAIGVSVLWCLLSGRFYRFIEKKSPAWVFVYALPAVLSLCALDAGAVGDTFSVLGLALGTVFGIFLERKFISFNPKCSKSQTFLKLAFGLIGSLILYKVPELAILALSDGIVASKAAELIAAFLTALWIFAAVPVLCRFIFERKR